MLYFNIPKLFKLRNISKPRIFLSQNGFTYSQAKNLATYRRSNISVNVVEKLCLALNCTPNDLLEWIPSKDSQVPENHPLHALKPSETLDLDELLKDIAPSQIPQIKKAIQQAKQNPLSNENP